MYPFRVLAGGLEVLALRRSAAGRCAGAWEAVHGHVDSGETVVQAARRELTEETGAVPERFYNLSRAESFYLHHHDRVAVVPAFAARIHPDVVPALSAEHDAWRWLPIADSTTVFAWPREHRALADLATLLKTGDAGVLEETLRIG